MYFIIYIFKYTCVPNPITFSRVPARAPTHIFIHLPLHKGLYNWILFEIYDWTNSVPKYLLTRLNRVPSTNSPSKILSYSVGIKKSLLNYSVTPLFVLTLRLLSFTLHAVARSRVEQTCLSAYWKKVKMSLIILCSVRLKCLLCCRVMHSKWTLQHDI